jgi:chromate transport protein ChrA
MATSESVELRPWNSFFEGPLSFPSNVTSFAERVQLNVTHFLVNYTVVLGVFLVGGAALAGGWPFLLCVAAAVLLLVLAAVIRAANKLDTSRSLFTFAACAGLAVLLFVVTKTHHVALWTAVTCALVVFGHAASHRPPLKAKVAHGIGRIRESVAAAIRQ